MKPFKIPASAADLLDGPDDLNLMVVQSIAVAELKGDDIQELADGNRTSQLF